MGNKKIEWSDEEIEYLKDNFENYTNKELSYILGKSYKNVTKQLRKQGLYKSKIAIDKLKSKINKSNGTDLSYEFVKNKALLYETKGDFYQFDRYAYNKAVKMGWIESVCSHMKVLNFSTPQLLLKHYLECVFNCNCSYNNRTAIKPYEIDCYFPDYKIGWEYNGRRFHIDKSRDTSKYIKCKEKGILLMTINEDNEYYRNYELNIKTQLINQLEVINSVLNINIKPEYILNLDNNISYPNILSENEIKIVNGLKLSEIKKIDKNLYNRISKYKLYTNESYHIINDKRKHNIYSSYEEYIKYLREKDYKSYSELLKHEHPYRVLKKFNIKINKLKNELYNV